MSERFSFTVDRHLVPDGSVIWNQEIDVNTTLVDSMNEHYVTAIEDTSQYLSVLDSSNEMGLDMNLTNPKLENETLFGEENMEEQQDQQIMLFSVDGSDDLYGVQMALDEEGNLQKYQFQFRQREDGEFEAIPETVQLLPLEEEQVEVPQRLGMQIYVNEDNSNEHILPDTAFAESLPAEENQDEVVYEEETDIKPPLASIKQEVQEEYERQTQLTLTDEDEEHEHKIEENSPIVEFAHEENSFVEEYSYHQSHLSTNLNEEQTIEHVEVNPDMEVAEDADEEEEEEGDNSDGEEYQIVEGLHITGDVEGSIPNEAPLSEDIEDKNSTNILRHALKTNHQLKIKKDNRLYLYVVQQTEKENVDSLALGMSNLCKPKQVNPRSILKSSHTMFQAKNEIEDVQNKRFAKCKEAVQARNFHNFINKTTVPQAPIRKDRLPRKQQIKPVERQDEEIVVQEVMVGSNGFVEKIDKKNLIIAEYVELTDSDEEYDPKKNTTKKKKHKKRRTITISDSEEESESSVIELDESDEEEATLDTSTKKRRGRPLKLKLDNPQSPTKKAKVVDIVAEEVTTKPEIPCPKCEKTFPSQNSLKTHLQHHNLQSTFQKALPTYKHVCDVCGDQFKNLILLKRHNCSNSKQTTCGVCLKRFTSVEALNAHKRSHVKEQLLKSTMSVRVSPRKSKPAAPTSPFKVPKSMTDFKCKTCGKVCSSLHILNVHLKSHKEFKCGRCASKFLGSLMLEKHLRESCVKSPRRSLKAKSSDEEREQPPSTTKKRFVRGVCEECDRKFATLTGLFEHQVLKHGKETPNKSCVKKERRKEYHTGIPANPKLRKAFAAIRAQINLSGEF